MRERERGRKRETRRAHRDTLTTEKSHFQDRSLAGREVSKRKWQVLEEDSEEEADRRTGPRPPRPPVERRPSPSPPSASRTVRAPPAREEETIIPRRRAGGTPPDCDVGGGTGSTRPVRTVPATLPPRGAGAGAAVPPPEEEEEEAGPTDPLPRRGRSLRRGRRPSGTTKGRR